MGCGQPVGEAIAQDLEELRRDFGKRLKRVDENEYRVNSIFEAQRKGRILDIGSLGVASVSLSTLCSERSGLRDARLARGDAVQGGKVTMTLTA